MSSLFHGPLNRPTAVRIELRIPFDKTDPGEGKPTHFQAWPYRQLFFSEWYTDTFMRHVEREEAFVSKSSLSIFGKTHYYLMQTSSWSP